MNGPAACLFVGCLLLAPQQPESPPSRIGLDFPVPAMTPKRTDVQPFRYKDVGAEIPNYTPGEQWGAQGKPLNQMQLPLEPAESIKHFVTPEGFNVELFVSEPEIAKPLCMTWDERGRLWIAESSDYPNNLQPQGEGNDRIKICEDTDGDGKADKFTVFADGLSIPTGLAIHKDGLLVHAAPYTYLLRDTDGDDKADEKKIILEGWGTGDTHAGPSNLQYGFDNWYYGMVGYSGFNGTVGDDRHTFRQGFYRFKPDGSKLEFLRSTNNNTWGIGFSEEGLLFGSTANGNPSEYMAVPNRYYEQVRGWSASVLNGIADSYKFKAETDKVRQVDHHGGYTAAAGHALYTARSYPKEYWNRVSFVTDGTGHLAGTFVIDQAGSGYRSSYKFNLLASDDEWSSPTMAEVGPDGSVWVIDWYNYIVQHNPTPAGFKTGKGAAYETPLRDKTHGRIYRVVYESATAEPQPKLDAADPAGLVKALAHPNMLWRLNAQRLLVDRGQADVAPALIALVNDQSVDAIKLNPGAIHALWTLHGLGLLNGTNADALKAAQAALKHPSAGVRLTAAKVLPPTAETAAALLASGLLSDADARVQLAGVLALADQPEEIPAVGKATAALALNSAALRDRWLGDAITSAAAVHSASFLAEWVAVSRSRPIRSGSSVGILMPLQGGNHEKALAIASRVAEHTARGKPTAEALATILAGLADADPAPAEAVLAGLAAGWPTSHKIEVPAETDALLAGLFDRLPTTGQAQLARLADGLGSKELAAKAGAIAEALGALVADADQPDAKRIEAAQQLIEFRPEDDAAASAVLDTITPQTDPALGNAFLGALARSRVESLGETIIERLPSLTPAIKPAAFRLLVGRPAATAALLSAAAEGRVSLRDLSLDQQQALAAYPDRRLAARARDLLAKGGGLPNADREKVVQAFLPIIQQKGDVPHGKAVFAEACAKCHKYGSEGSNIGPDLTGMAVHPKEELLVHILDPSRSVEGTFRTYTVAMLDGQVLTGLLASETKTSIELVDTEAKTQVLQRADIEELRVSDKSLMPEGFESQLKKEDIRDLLEFLTQRGKYLPLDLAKVATVVSTKGMFNNEDSQVERLIFPDWTPKTFKGVPFVLVDPKGDRVPNAVMLRGRNGGIPPRMPTSVTLACGMPAKALHFLSGVSGWGAQGPSEDGPTALIVRLHYAGGATEEFPLREGREFADYIGEFDVPGSERAFRLRGQQIRYFAVTPGRPEIIERVELVKGNAASSAPVVMAITAEAPE